MLRHQSSTQAAPDCSAILHFWFGELRDGWVTDTSYNRMWWQGSAQLDAHIREHFGAAVEQAAAGEYASWRATAPGCLALILLLDQFPRNMHRGSAGAYQYDAQALETCLYGLERGFDQQLALVQRSFFAMPLEHSEKLEHQERSVAFFSTLLEQSPAQHHTALRNALDYALQHRDLIQRFGRFPHRNTVLERPSTQEEERYLAQDGVSFGQ